MRVVHDIHYFQICKNHVVKFDALNQRYKNLLSETEKPSRLNEQLGEIELLKEAAKVGNSRAEAGHISIVFAAMCLEALIYDFGVSRTSKEYFDDNLDSLSPLSKWVVVPQLVTGEAINDKLTLTSIKTLFRKRNKLVHFKSRLVSQQSSFFEAGRKPKQDSLPQTVFEAIKTVFLATEQLKKLAPDWENYSWYDPQKEANRSVKKYA